MTTSLDIVDRVSGAIKNFYEAQFAEPDALHLIADFGSVTGKVAESHPELTDQIRALNLAMRSADTVRRTWPSMFPNAVGQLFIGVEDAHARRFLGDIVLTRVSKPEGHEMNGKAPRREHAAMLKEMGLATVTETYSLNLEMVVAKIMEGQLQLTPQT